MSYSLRPPWTVVYQASLSMGFPRQEYWNGLPFPLPGDLLHPWTAAHQASLFIANSRSLLKFMSIELVMPSKHLILCHPLLLLPPSPPSIRVFSNESTLRMRWPKYWSFSFSIIPSKEIPGLISLQSKALSRVFSNTTVQKHQFFGAQPSSQSNSHIHT